MEARCAGFRAAGDSLYVQTSRKRKRFAVTVGASIVDGRSRWRRCDSSCNVQVVARSETGVTLDVEAYDDLGYLDCGWFVVMSKAAQAPCSTEACESFCSHVSRGET
jgi:hypothetical protein